MSILNQCVYSVRKNFLGDELAAQALDTALQREAFNDGRVGSHNARVDSEVRQTLVAGGVAKYFPFLIERLLAELPSIAAEVGMKGFVSESADKVLLAYKDGHFYARHIDTFVQGEAVIPPRKLTCVYYFHHSPKRFSGGQIRLYPLVGDEYVELDPDHDQLVAFPSFMPHEVLPVSVPGNQLSDSRFAITFFFK